MAWQMHSENAAKPRCSKESTGQAGKAIAKGGNAEQNRTELTHLFVSLPAAQCTAFFFYVRDFAKM
jgi:hypothetical protein